MINPNFSDLHVRIMPHDLRLWQLTQPFEYRNGDTHIIVHSGFRTNFATVPRFLWGIFSPIDTSARPAVIHDFMYNTRYRCTRKEADQMFYTLLREEGVSWLKAKCMYYGVRFLSERYFDKR